MKRAAIIAAVAALTAVLTATDAETGSGSKFALSDPNAPIDISANRLDADQNAKTLVYSGNAIVNQGDVHLRTDVLRVVALGGKTAEKIYAEGHVVVTAPSGTATGDKGVYDVDPRIITLTGHVVLARDENVMRGETLTVNLISGLAKLDGKVREDPKTGEKKGGRIQGLFLPKSIENRKN
jgi:lipopolysaccharide export system protein LptA